MERKYADFDSRILLGAFIAISSALCAETETLKSLEPFLTNHCITCHDSETRKGNLDLRTLKKNLDDNESIRRWTLVFDRVASREMPPKSEDRPTAEANEAFLHTLRESLARVDGSRRLGGIRRLNRVEYENTIRDLFDIRIDVKDLLPLDQSSQGFDTIGEALGISSEQMESYLQAANTVLDRVYGFEQEPSRIDVSKPIGRDEFASRSVERVFIKSEDDSLIAFQDYFCPLVFSSGKATVEGTYRVQIRAKAYHSNHPLVMAVYGGDVIVGRVPTHLVGYCDIPLGDDWTTVTFEDYLEANGSFKITPYRLRGPQTGPNRFKGPGLMVGEVSVEGPLEPWPPHSREKLLGTINLKTAGILDARKLFLRLLPKAFRRRIREEEVEPFLALVRSTLDDQRPFRDALNVGLKAVLCSPEFLMREEVLDAVDPTRVSADALASRMSYFLWSSMPDDELFDLADSGKLTQSDVIREQVERMLREPKSQRFVESFTGQWLGLRDINFTEPDARLYPEFDEMLRYTMVQETRRFFQEILDRDEPLLDFVDSSWAILNERLAIHYGIGGIRGQEFRRVELPKGSVRGGVLTQASVMKVTANGTSTSPVVRGNWVLSNILGQPSPPPPPNVPGIEPDIRTAKTMRERLAKHRSISSCATCHDRIDPPGFALESFDPIGGFRGTYRTLGAGQPLNLEIDGKRVQYKSGSKIDPSGKILDGRSFADVRQFKQLLLEDKHLIAKSLTEKLLIYSLGRRLGFADRPVVESIIQKVRQRRFGFRSLIHEIIQSKAFAEK